MRAIIITLFEALCLTLILTQHNVVEARGDTQVLEQIVKELENDVRDVRRRLDGQRAMRAGPDPAPHPDDDIDLTDEWVAQLAGGPERATQVAKRAGFNVVREVSSLPDTYVFRRQLNIGKSELSKRSEPSDSDEPTKEHNKALSDFDEVQFAEQQRVRRRVKRDVKLPNEEQHLTEVDRLFNDPMWPKMWHLHDTRDMPNLPKLDLHVIGAWKAGYNGTGAVVSVLDDGIQRTHPDLINNYAPEASYDLNDNDDDPTPQQNDDNKHGTRCAGEIGMEANNGICGVGVAYGARVGGIRMLDGTVTDRVEAEALSYNLQKVDVFSASWGPTDDGMTLEGPGRLVAQAFATGVKEGRGGKGTIYVWASGNGGHYQDDCNCDGYTDSPMTLSISSASQQGRFPWYGEKCASTLATTYSSGAYTDQQIATVDLEGCTTDHTGTSAAAPLAAGIVAVALHANSNLTWRDVQHITVWTSEPAPLLQNDGWHKNSRGLWANIRFGFGLMNADAFVKAAAKWTTVPKLNTCVTTLPDFKTVEMLRDEPTVVRFTTDACGGQVKYLESLQLITDLEYTRRGNLAVWLTAPSGTRTKLLSPRRRDDSKDGFKKWPFMSVHTWGEDPRGTWQLEVFDRHAHSTENNEGRITNLTLVLYGTSEQPAHYGEQKQYNLEYNEQHDDRKKRVQDQLEDLMVQGQQLVQRYKRDLDNLDNTESHIGGVDRVLDAFESVHDEKQLSESSQRHDVKVLNSQSVLREGTEHHYDADLYNLK